MPNKKKSRLKKILSNFTKEKFLKAFYKTFKIVKDLSKNPLYQLKIFWYRRVLSDRRTTIWGKPKCGMPLIVRGCGTIDFGKGTHLGGISSPDNYGSHCYIEARNPGTKIEFKGVSGINNHFSIVAEGEGDAGGVLFKGNDFIGFNVTIVDSDFHGVGINDRSDPSKVKTAKVIIGHNVFIGSNVLILKGVEIGDNSVVGAGSVVTKSCPPNVVIAGNPAKVIKQLV